MVPMGLQRVKIMAMEITSEGSFRQKQGPNHQEILPSNNLKMFIHRNPEIPDDSDSEHGSDSEDSVPPSQDSAIGSQESVPENPSPVPSDTTTVLYANPESYTHC